MANDRERNVKPLIKYNSEFSPLRGGQREQMVNPGNGGMALTTILSNLGALFPISLRIFKQKNTKKGREAYRKPTARQGPALWLRPSFHST